MLNTVMALWNHNPGENKQRIVKIFFTFLFISSSIFLLLFTLNSSAWFPFVRMQQLQTKKEEPVRMSNHSAIPPARNTPASKVAVTGITPTPTAKVSGTQTAVRSCVPTPPTVIHQQAAVTPQKAVIYYGNSSLENKSSTQRHVRSKVMHVRKSKMHSRKRSKRKVIATPVSHAKETLHIALPASPIPVSTAVQQTVTPIATASVTVTVVPIEGTVVSSVPDAVVNSMPGTVVMSATPDISTVSTNSFGQNLKRKAVMHVPVAPLARVSKKSRTSNNKNVKCSESTTHRTGIGGPSLNGKQRHVGLLLGGVLLGMLMLSCFMFAWRREDYSALETF
jgi:hypothetical protein